MDELKDDLQSKIADYSKMAESGKDEKQTSFVFFSSSLFPHPPISSCTGWPTNQTFLTRLYSVPHDALMPRIALCSENLPANLGSSFSKKMLKETARKNVKQKKKTDRLKLKSCRANLAERHLDNIIENDFFSVSDTGCLEENYRRLVGTKAIN